MSKDTRTDKRLEWLNKFYMGYMRDVHSAEIAQEALSMREEIRQLIEQSKPPVGERGEELVAEELRKREFEVRNLGKARYYDLIAKKGNKETWVQVKTVKSGDFQLQAIKFLKIDIIDGKQAVKGKQPPIDQESVWVFVKLAEPNEFYLLRKGEVQDFVFRRYSFDLEKIGGERPKNRYSFHHAIAVRDLKEWKDNWKILES